MMMAHVTERARSWGVDVSSVDGVLNIQELLLEESSRASERAQGPGTETRSHRGSHRQDMAACGQGEGQAPLLVEDDRTPPDPGHARVALIDLRKGQGDEALILEREGEAEVKVHARHADRRWSTVELRAGQWSLTPGEELLDLAEGTIVTLVLYDGDEGPRSLMMVEPARLPSRESTAMTRLVNLGASEALSLGSRVTHDSPGVRKGEFTPYTEVDAKLPGLLIGTALAKRLDAQLGTEVTLVTPLRGVDNTMLGTYGVTPSSARHVVTGIFESGFHEYDVRLGLVNIQAAQRFLNARHGALAGDQGARRPPS